MASRAYPSVSGHADPGTARVRPVAVVRDLRNEGRKAAGRVQPPLRIAWSEPRRTYDLEDRYDRRRVYEQVLAEGTADDVRYFVRADDLLDLWDELVVPQYVCDAWEPWIRRRRST